MQKTIGLIGGMSWESTAVYYKEINEMVRERFGGLHSADIILYSVDFDRIVGWQKSDQWAAAADYLGEIGLKLEAAGADCALICTNTMHLIAEPIAAKMRIPLIHIVDITGQALRAAGVKKPLLLATSYTMEQPFYRERLRETFGIEAMVPDKAGRDAVHNIIFGELCCGIVKDSSRAIYLDVIAAGRAAGCDAVILGCTEIGMLIGADDTGLPTFDSTLLHAMAAVDFANADRAA